MPELAKLQDLTEEHFNRFLPEYLQRADRTYFTPVYIARIAAQWLTEGEKRNVLDIGAGIGKFCIVGATYSSSHFYGIEYRPSLVQMANRLIAHFGVENAKVINQNITEVDFSNYEAFYMFNPFYENLVDSKRMNGEVVLAGSLYNLYLKHTETQLDRTRPGTRLVTFHGNNYEIPDSFKKVREAENGKLKLWIRQ